jgi:hypothetical protein
VNYDVHFRNVVIVASEIWGNSPNFGGHNHYISKMEIQIEKKLWRKMDEVKMLAKQAKERRSDLVATLLRILPNTIVVSTAVRAVLIRFYLFGHFGLKPVPNSNLLQFEEGRKDVMTNHDKYVWVRGQVRTICTEFEAIRTPHDYTYQDLLTASEPSDGDLLESITTLLTSVIKLRIHWVPSLITLSVHCLHFGKSTPLNHHHFN